MVPTIENIFPEYIRLDGGTQPRAKIDQEVCDDYGERMKAGEKFPAIDVFFDGKDYWLADGFHRVRAYVLAVPGEAIACNIYQGSLADAQWHSYSVNKTHGLRRTNEDKLQATRAALAHPNSKGVSDAALADYVGVHRQTVQKLRHELAPAERDLSIIDKSTPRRGRDGRTIHTARIGGKRKGVVDLKPSRCTASRTAQPGSAPVSMNKMTTLSMPPNPVMGAKMLIEVFDADYLRTLVKEILNHLKGVRS